MQQTAFWRPVIIDVIAALVIQVKSGY